MREHSIETATGKNLEQRAGCLELHLHHLPNRVPGESGYPRKKSTAVSFFDEAFCSSSKRTAPVPQPSRIPSCETSSTCPGSPSVPESIRARQMRTTSPFKVVLATGEGLKARSCQSIDSAVLLQSRIASDF